jgi:sulfoxide reductase heme-binding subunit YedZ
MSTAELWYLARASGVVSLILLTVVVVLGIVTRARGSLGALTGHSRLVVVALHRSASLLAVAFLGIHITTLMFDPYAQLKLIDLVMPFTSSYRPLFVGLGALALDLMAALVITSLLRNRIGRRVWRAVHWLAYAMWPVALLHGIGSGTDRSRSWMIGVDITCVLAVLAASALHPRFGGTERPRPSGVPIATPDPLPARRPVGAGAGASR